MKVDEKDEARRLRAQGWAITSIAEELAVAKSSVSRWTRDIELTAEQIKALAESGRRSGAQLAGAASRRTQARVKRCEAQELGRERAREGDPLHRAGCMLFWAEGSRDRNSVTFTNSDPDMLGLFVRFLRDSCDVPLNDISFSVNCHLNNGLSLGEIERWWLDRLGLPASALRTAAVDRVSVRSKRRRRLHPYGTGRVMVHSTQLVQSLYGAIQEYAGFSRPEWLD